jgi:zinc transport system substrate-binding protein
MLYYNNPIGNAQTRYLKPQSAACRPVADPPSDTVMMMFFKLTLALALILALILGGIGKATAAEIAAETIAAAKAAAEPNVVASIFPLHSLTAGVMRDVGEPVLLLDGGLSPHDFALKPSQARLLQSADLVIWVGEDLEYPLARFAENLPPGRSFPLIAGAAARQNPHIWLDPQAAKRIVSAVAARLRALDPGHAADYGRNGAALEARIDALEEELAAILGPLRDIPYIVFHDAYGPFEKRFGLNNVGAVTAEPEHRPGARQIRRMRELVATTGARCAFREPQFEPHIAAAIAEDSALRFGELDPLGAGLEPGVNGYFLLMRNLAHGFAACLSHS